MRRRPPPLRTQSSLRSARLLLTLFSSTATDNPLNAADPEQFLWLQARAHAQACATGRASLTLPPQRLHEVCALSANHVRTANALAQYAGANSSDSASPGLHSPPPSHIIPRPPQCWTR